MTGTIHSICISTQKGTKKKEVSSAEIITNWGIEHDAHAGSWHRQLSLLSVGSIEKMKEKGYRAQPGDFAENVTIEGIDFSQIRRGDKMIINDVIVLEITQIGKECHTGCEIQQITGDCIMPREGVFARVVQGGKIEKGHKVIRLSRAEDLPPLNPKS